MVNLDFQTFTQFLNESKGDAEAGFLEINRDSIQDITDYAIKKCKEHGRDIYEEVPNFDENLRLAKEYLSIGSTKRKDMPVIPSADVKEFQRRLEKGYIDINEPFHFTTNPKNPFPEGLSGKVAKEFIERGLKDGSSEDDKIKVNDFSTSAINLKPIQHQIYVDKSIDKIAQDGAKNCIKFLESRKLITSLDSFIIDGHHRLMTSFLIDPFNIKLSGIQIDLDIKTLLHISLAYSDAIGNKRNK